MASALNGSDLNPSDGDISATFNSSIGTTCAFPNVWYYGLDANPPGSQIDFVTVLLHELGHGLGFSTLVSLSTGAKLQGFDDAFERNLENHGATPPDYPSMTDAQRVTASTATGNLHWTGPHLRAAAGALTAGTVGDHVRMYAPSPSVSGSSVSHFDTALTPNQLMEPSYTVPLHNPSLTLPAFRDIGWTVLPGFREDVAVAFFSSAGIWQFLNNRTWQKVNANIPLGGIWIADLDGSGQSDLIASTFLSSSGIWVRYNNSAWKRINTQDPDLLAVGDLDNSGQDDLIADFGASGLWVYYNNSTWTRISTGDVASGLGVGDLDGNGVNDLVADFGAGGLWVYYNNSIWTRINTGTVDSYFAIPVGDLDGNGKDDVVVDFGASGLWVYYNNGTWTRINTGNPLSVAIGDFDGNGKDDIVADFRSGGLWVYSNNSTWTRINASGDVGWLATGDLDTSGKDEVLAGYTSGLWARYNNSTWVRLNPNQPIIIGIASGSIDN